MGSLSTVRNVFIGLLFLPANHCRIRNYGSMKSNKKETLEKLLGEQPIQTLGDNYAFVHFVSKTVLNLSTNLY